MSWNVLIVDDHPIFRQGLSMMIASHPNMEVIAEADDQQEATLKFLEHKPDIVIVDLKLQRGSGLELIKQLRSQSADTKLLVLSMHDDRLFGELAMASGADGYVNKEEAPNTLITALQTIMAGKKYLSNTLIDYLTTNTVANQTTSHKTNQKKPLADLSGCSLPDALLSQRELQVFAKIAEGLSSKAIAESLHISPKTVDTHKEHIKRKLNICDNIKLIQKAVAWALQSSAV